MSDYDTIHNLMEDRKIPYLNDWIRDPVSLENKVTRIIYTYDRGVEEHRIEFRFTYLGMLESIRVSP